MKLNVNKLVLASAVVAASGHVAALTPTQIADCRAGGGTCPSTEALLTVDISGASATTQVMQDLAVEICKAGDIAHYKDFIGASKAGKRLNTYACLADGAKVPGVTDGTPILIANQSPGSFEGVGPVARKQPVEFMNVEGGNCTLDTSGAVDEYKCTISTTSPNRTSLWFCSGEDSPGDALTYTRDTRCSIPNGGVSDVEPDMFTFSENSPAPVTDEEVAVLESGTFLAQPFGVLVTKTFADALRAQGDETTLGADGFSYPVLPKAYIRASFAKDSTLMASDIASSLSGNQANLAVCRR
ncbi:MAG TPA: hypothetical protein DCZ13_00235, partial [Porticoccaceae bacterium]|nr:hypothetical protein [Porticoccaceae bacterium]